MATTANMELATTWNTQQLLPRHKTATTPHKRPLPQHQ